MKRLPKQRKARSLRRAGEAVLRVRAKHTHEAILRDQNWLNLADLVRSVEPPPGWKKMDYEEFEKLYLGKVEQPQPSGEPEHDEDACKALHRYEELLRAWQLKWPNKDIDTNDLLYSQAVSFRTTIDRMVKHWDCVEKNLGLNPNDPRLTAVFYR